MPPWPQAAPVSPPAYVGREKKTRAFKKSFEKVYIIPLTIQSGLLHSSNYKIGFSTPELFKIGQIIPQAVLDGVFATVTVILSFSFLFISAESLKNHSKSQKNHKIENSILLDST
jgi:hypothetical protein